MSTDTYQHTFNWKGHGNTVVATGSFDDWKTSLPPLNKQPDGTFSGQIGVPFGQKIVYKYVVDGQWMHNMDEQTETDASGNVNNVFNVPERSEVPAPASTDAVLPVPESVSTVSGDISSSEPATTTSLPQSTESQSSTASAQQKASDLVGQAQQQASETAGQVQQKTSESVQAAKQKVDEVVPQVQESLSNAAQTTKENALPAAAAVATGAAAVVAAGVATVIGANGSPEEKTEKSGSITPTRSLSASATPFVPGGEKPQDPSPTPSPSNTQGSIPTIPSNSFIDSKVPEEDKAHSTSVVPKETASSTSAAPVYDEKTSVVAKDASAPSSISTPLGNTAQASKEVSEKKDGEPFPEPEHVDGLVAPEENPSDKPLFAAGAAALGAVVAGATILGEKAYHAAVPHVQQAADTVSTQAQQAVNTTSESTKKAIDQAPQTASNLYNSAAQSTSNALDSASKTSTQVANSTSETASTGYQQATEASQSYLESAKVGAGKGLETVQNTAIGGAILGAVGLGGVAASKKEEEVSTGVPNKDITPLPVSEAPVAPSTESTPLSNKAVAPTSDVSARPSTEAPTLPDKEITPLPASEAPVSSSNPDPTSSTHSAPLPVPKEPSAPLPVAKDSGPVDAKPVDASKSLRPDPVVSTPQPVSTSSPPPPVAVEEPSSVTHTASVPRTRESSAAAAPSTQSPETPVKSGQQQTPYSTAPSTPANATSASSVVGGKKTGQEALGQGVARPGGGLHERVASNASVSETKKKEGRRASGFFSRLFGKKEQN
ncbi:hypothetical protein JCM5350_001389 [Sporobolomyces pararoseus]